MTDHDVIIIGTGQAGVPLAKTLADEGKRVLIAERGAPGGTCINYGCTPTKTLIASAKAAHVARSSGRLGVHAEVKVDFAAVMARKSKMVSEWSSGIGKKLKDYGKNLTFVEGHARFVGPREIEVNGERHRAAQVVINTGARSRAPKIPGLDSVEWLNSTSLLSVPNLPEHLVVIGGGYIGCELGQAFARLGSKVTLIDAAPHLMSREDPDISEQLEGVFRGEGITLELSAKIEGVAKAGKGVEVSLGGGKKVSGSHLLVVVGRQPNTDDLGCDKAGIKLDDHGFITVDDGYRTSVENVFAVGDCTPQPQFTHTAWDDNRLVHEVMTGKKRSGRETRIIPYSTFTDPQVAGVGLSESMAKQKKIPYELATLKFSHVARAIEVDEKAGILKVLVDPKTGRVLGANFCGSEAGELIHIIVTLMRANAPLSVLIHAEFVHPTFAEGVQSLAMMLPQFA